MEMVSRRQSHHIAGLFTTNVDWDAIPFETGEAISGNPTEFGRHATRFVQNGGRTTIMMTDGIVPPPGGMIHILSVPVDESRPWPDAVKAAGPDTGRDWDIWKVGDQYPPAAVANPSLKQVIIANFGNVVQSEEALTWGKEQKLKPATPRACFAVSEHYPALHHYLGMGPLAVVTLAQCSCAGLRHVQSVWFTIAERRAYLDRFDNDWGGCCWFAFEHESS